MKHTAAQVLVRTLIAHGVQRAFCVPGESYLAVLDALYDERDTLELITCRQEGGAALMAEASGKLTGKPGICFVTRGPGAMNASIGVHVAMQDSTPMVLFVGQVARAHKGREAFQEFDTRDVFSGLAKWATDIDAAERTFEIVSRALHTAQSGRPGPVVIGLPEDMLRDTVDVSAPIRKVAQTPAVVSANAIREFYARLSERRRPLVIAGGGGWDAATSQACQTFVETLDLPVAAAFRRQDIIDNRHPNYIGHVGLGIDPALASTIEEADMLIVLGARLGEATTSGYTRIRPGDTKHTLVHVHPSGDELNSVYPADQAIACPVHGFLDTAIRLAPELSPSWTTWRREARRNYEAFIKPQPMPGDVQLGEIIAWLNTHLPADAIVTNGAGNYCIWVNRHFQYRRFTTQLGPTNGSMGYGLPAAIAAALEHRTRCVVAFAGDGCFLMNAQELATAMQYGISLIVVVVNNGVYGTIRMHQQRDYPHRPHGTQLANPDFATFARAFGAHGTRIDKTAAFFTAFEAARQRGGVSLLEIVIPEAAIAPGKTLDDLAAG